MKHFQSLATELQANKPFYSHFYNIPAKKQRQSSVAMVFRLTGQRDYSHLRSTIEAHYHPHPDSQQSICSLSTLNEILKHSKDSQVEMLFAQRSSCEADFNSGNVCFPGGKSDGDESDLQACIREVRQEVGLTLIQANSPYLNVYLGKFKHNFFYRNTSKQSVYISCHVFLILSPSVTMILNSSEIYQTRWVNFENLTTQSPFIFRGKENISALNSFPKPLRFLQDSVKDHLEYVEYATIEVNLDRPLWGLSLHLYLHMLRIILKGTPRNEALKLREHVRAGQHFKIKFNWLYPLGYPAKWFVSNWHRTLRVNAFKEPPTNDLIPRGLTIAILAILIFLWILKSLLKL